MFNLIKCTVNRKFLISMGIVSVILLSACKIEKSHEKADAELWKLIDKMTLEEKVSMVHGASGQDKDGLDYAGYLPGIERLGIPSLGLCNGPSGAGPSWSTHRDVKRSTAFPVPVAQASTWNKDLLYTLGQAMGSETRAHGRDIIAGPNNNIIRVPEGGRVFEMFSEDPYLSATCAVQVTKGIQDLGTMATTKHYVANSQETDRCCYNAVISQRALREIYLPSFEYLVKEGKVASIMAAYNKVNGHLCAEHPKLLNGIVKDQWGFTGFIMTDWGTDHNAIMAAKAGLDLEMSGWGKYDHPKFKTVLADAIREGLVDEKKIDKMIYRILHEMKRFGHIGQPKTFPEPEVNTEKHQQLALEVAKEAIVLLKNENEALPLDPLNTKKLALFGDANIAKFTGGGSSWVAPPYKVSPLQGISERLKDGEVTFYKDYKKGVQADAALIFLSDTSTEGKDRESISLAQYSDMITEIAEKYGKTIVFLRTPGAYTMPWIDKVDAVFQAWYPGMEEGTAEAALLFGDVSPSGKLPVTFGVDRSDFPATRKEEFPGVNYEVLYTEDIFVGYRYFEHEGTDILFPFGHGLSYTTFEYSDLKLSSDKLEGDNELTINYTLTNNGDREGAEVAQLYIRDIESNVTRPVKELKGFEKISLNPGERKNVQHTIRKRDLSYWDENESQWKAEEGEYKVLIGSSSAKIELEGSFDYRN